MISQRVSSVQQADQILVMNTTQCGVAVTMNYQPVAYIAIVASQMQEEKRTSRWINNILVVDELHQTLPLTTIIYSYFQ